MSEEKAERARSAITVIVAGLCVPLPLCARPGTVIQPHGEGGGDVDVAVIGGASIIVCDDDEIEPRGALEFTVVHHQVVCFSGMAIPTRLLPVEFVFSEYIKVGGARLP